jgi:hypothetical protein
MFGCSASDRVLCHTASNDQPCGQGCWKDPANALQSLRLFPFPSRTRKTENGRSEPLRYVTAICPTSRDNTFPDSVFSFNSTIWLGRAHYSTPPPPRAPLGSISMGQQFVQTAVLQKSYCECGLCTALWCLLAGSRDFHSIPEQELKSFSCWWKGFAQNVSEFLPN